MTSVWRYVSLIAIATLLSLHNSRLQDNCYAEDFFLTIAGGYSPSGNQASLEKNVLYFQRLLNEQKIGHKNLDVFFADGNSKKRSLQVKDLDSVPLPNRLMAEFFGSQRNLGFGYRPHQIPDIKGGTSIENISDWFEETGRKMKSGDRLLMYVSSHGGSSKNKKNPHDTTIYLWNNKTIKVSELVDHLDSLPQGVKVVTVMVQCHAGGFARMIFDKAKPESGICKQDRIGFFATVHSRPAAGCTPDVNEKNYKEYSIYFWSAIAGQTRSGEPIELPDFDKDGSVSFAEAHAYCILTSDTIDLPIKTSGEFLRTVSKFAESKKSTPKKTSVKKPAEKKPKSNADSKEVKSKETAEKKPIVSQLAKSNKGDKSNDEKAEGQKAENDKSVNKTDSKKPNANEEAKSPRLLSKNAPYSEVLKLADPVDRAILEGLSKQLKLKGEDRIASARKTGSTRSRSSRSGSRRGFRPQSESYKLRRKIASDIKKRWPELGNVLNPLAVELITTRADEFVKAVEGHKDYKKYRKLIKEKSKGLSATEKRVKYERFVRIAENVILAANFEKIASDSQRQQLYRILASESTSLVAK